MTAPLAIGLDVGGTKTAALAAANGTSRRFSGDGVHALRDGLEAVADTVADLVAQARSAFDGAAVAGVAVGVAGAGRSEEQHALAEALRQRLGGARVAVTHDADVAYQAAWGDESGALLLVGTGSFVLARTEGGDALRAGGWGALLGDDGSGTALGRIALRAVLAALDGGPPTALVDRADLDFGLATTDDVIRAVYTERRPLASFAPLLLTAAADGDWAASSALDRETNVLAQQVGWLATRAAGGVRERLAIAGGLVNEDVYRASLTAALERHLPGWSVAPCEAEPVEGALALAQRLVAANR